MTKAELERALRRERAARKRDAAARERADRRSRDAVAHQAATGEILRVIASSPGQRQPVFDAIVRTALRLLDGFSASVLTVEDDTVHCAANASTTPELDEALRRTYPRPLASMPRTARALAERKPFVIPDTEAIEEGVVRATARLRGYRSVVAVPIVHADRAIGTLNVTRREPGPFSDDKIALLQTFADQAVIAIENVRLFTELQQKNAALTEALDQQTATSEVLRAISTSPGDVQPVFDTVVANARRLLGGSSAAVLRLADDHLHLAALTSTSPAGDATVRALYPLRIAPDGITGEVIASRRPYVVTDIETDSKLSDAGREVGRARGYCSQLWIPVLRHDAVIGVIVVSRVAAGSFADNEIALLQTFADQAVIAIENVRLFKELQQKNQAITEALEQQTATAEILSVISSSPTDVRPVFEAIVRSAARLCDSPRSNAMTVDGDFVHLVARCIDGELEDVHDRSDPFHRDFPARIEEMGFIADAIRESRVFTSVDAQVDERNSPARREAARGAGYRSLAIIPMVREGTVIGTLNVARTEVKPYTPAEIQLLRTFADQAVIAIENVRLFAELQARNRDLTDALERQTATAELLRVISRSHTEVQPVFDTIADSAMRLLRAWSVVVGRFDGELIHLAALRGGAHEPDRSVLDHFPTRPTSGLTLGRCLLEGSVIQIIDVETEAEPVAATRQMARARGWRSALAVPMLRDGQPIGAIMVTRAEVGGFGAGSVELLQTFADQAVIAIENVRLFTELQERNRQVTEALDRQTATAEVLRVISHSQTDLEPVFATIADSALGLLRAWSVLIVRYDGMRLDLGAVRGGLPDSERSQRERFPMPLASGFLIADCIRTRAPQQEPDCLAHPDPGVRERARRRGHRALLGVPMLRGGEAVGAILVTRVTAGTFAEPEVALLQTFADQAVIAIENARLLSELQTRTEDLTRSVGQLTALGEVGQAVSSSLELETVLSTIVTRAVQLAGANAGTIWEYDQATEEFALRITQNVDTAQLLTRADARLRKGEGAVGRLAVTHQPVQIPDITAEGAYESRLREVLVGAGTRALLAVPLLRESRIVGGLVVSRRTPGEFPSEVVEVLKTFATQSALAIQNARLFRQLEIKSRELEVASQHKSEFLASMSHELRTPLNAIIGFSDVLLQRMFGEVNEKQQEYLQDILASGKHLLSLINDILDLSKIEAGRMELDITDFDLPMAVDNALTLMRERASRRSITLDRVVDARLGEVRADERKVKQVLLNLLSNAVKFTPEGGRIHVRAAPNDEGMVEISVADTGIGIAPEDQEAVFEEFRQVGAAEQRVEGTGLGLALCRRFVELHGGRIWLKSQVGSGSTFTFTIPVRRGG